MDSRFFLFKKIILVCLIFLIGLGAGLYLYNAHWQTVDEAIADDLRLDEQEATIRAIKKVMPSVVSIMVYEPGNTLVLDLGAGGQEIKSDKMLVGSGTGFLISPDGLILTNKHVVNVENEKEADFRIVLNSGKKYYAQLIGKDPINDLAVLKIFDKDLPYVELGDSASLEIGATVIAIGNSLGKYQNSVTKGIVSALCRNLSALDNSGQVENLGNVIQTDAEINLGNSGGPLIDLSGKVVGVNVAIDQTGFSIGFAIPVNDAKPVIKSVKEIGRIVRPRLGVRYVMITPDLVQKYALKSGEGALIAQGDNGLVDIIPGSPAEKAGLRNGDIILEINAIKIEGKNTLQSIIQRYKPGDRIGLRVLRGDEIIIKIVILDEFK